MILPQFCRDLQPVLEQYKGLNLTINLHIQRNPLPPPSKVDLVIKMFPEFGMVYYVSFSNRPYFEHLT